MSRASMMSALAGGLALVLSARSVWSQPTQQEIKQRLEQRHGALLRLKQAGKVGEASNGYLEAVKPEVARDSEAKKTIDAENADRKALYGLLAKETGTNAEEVGRQNAILKFKKAGPDEYFKGKDNAWRRKAEMLKGRG